MTTITVTTPTNRDTNTLPPTTTEQMIAQFLGLSTYWTQQQELLGKRVARYRRYYDGDHDMKLNSFQRKLLQVDSSDDSIAINHMPTVADTMADRAIVQAIEGVKPDGVEATGKPVDTTAMDEPNAAIDPTKWAQEVQENNDFDVIQGELALNAIVDGDAYLMVEWDNDDEQAKFTVEPAWDGQSGILMDYPSRSLKEPRRAIKVWQLDGDSGSVITRMNVYYPDRVEKFTATALNGFTPYNDDKGGSIYKWDLVDGAPIGIPVIHFRNGGRGNYGKSELRDAIPVQNALNRFHYSSVIAAELTAYAIYVEINLGKADSTIMPGMSIKVNDVTTDMVLPNINKIEGSDLTPILNQIEAERRMIAEITRTPSPDLSGGSGQSGEYLKQLEVGLIGKVKRFTTRAGSSWEQVFKLAWRCQQAYGTKKPPAFKRFVCKWKSPEIRNDAQVVTNAKTMAPFVSEKETLRQVADVYDYDDQKIEQILEEKQQQKAEMVKQLGSSIPSFGGGNNPAPVGGMNQMAQRMNQQVAEMSRA